MKGVERIGVSLEQDLPQSFDGLIHDKGYTNRSEAIRDLIRRILVEDKLAHPNSQAVAAVLLVYDHHTTKLTERLLHLQHSHLLETISSMHVHLDHHHCLEIIVLKGKVSQINTVGQQMISLKGVKLGRVNIMSALDSD
jgi:CopG family nickel-responsive transcriptional regulator